MYRCAHCYTHTLTHLHTHTPHLHLYRCAHSYTHALTHLHTHTPHLHLYRCAHSYTHTLTHLHTHTCLDNQQLSLQVTLTAMTTEILLIKRNTTCVGLAIWGLQRNIMLKTRPDARKKSKKNRIDSNLFPCFELFNGYISFYSIFTHLLKKSKLVFL